MIMALLPGGYLQGQFPHPGRQVPGELQEFFQVRGQIFFDFQAGQIRPVGLDKAPQPVFQPQGEAPLYCQAAVPVYLQRQGKPRKFHGVKDTEDSSCSQAAVNDFQLNLCQVIG